MHISPADLIPFVMGGLVLMLVVGVFLLLSARLDRTHPYPRPRARPPAAQVVRSDHSPLRTGSRWLTRQKKIGIGLTLVIGSLGTTLYGLYLLFEGIGDLAGGTKGRALRVRGAPRLPERAGDTGWSDGSVPALDLPSAERTRVAAEWLAAARMEHASVPAFALLTVELAALGAPADLLERAHQAGLDEIRHARRCYALASAFAGSPQGAGPIQALAAGAPRRPVDRVQVALDALTDGALAEGLAADAAAHGATTARDPLIAAALIAIADDEERHAELAWAVLAWCLATGGDPVRRAVRGRALELTLAAPTAPAQLAHHGFPDATTLADLGCRRLAAVQARVAALLS